MLVSAIRQQVLALLASVQPESRYKVLVLDAKAKEIIDLVCEKSELLNRQVANVLLIDEPRPTEGYLEAVYIVEQTTYNLGCIQADFVRMPKRYAAAHVYLLPRVGASDTELQRFKNSSVARFLKKAQPAPITTYALEERLYSLGTDYASTVLYHKACSTQAMDLVKQSGVQLANLCEALGVNPYVRYSCRWKNVRTTGWTFLIAQAAAQEIAEARVRYMTPQLELETRPTLLVLDRTVDLTAPLRHEFGFQSMALDVLNAKFSPELTLNHFNSTESETEGVLNERDNVWVDLRHKHIVAVTQELNNRIRELRQTNPHLADPTTDVSVNDVRNMLAGLPEFMKERESVTLNLDMAMECMNAVEKLNLKEIAELEQTLVLGTKAQDGGRPLESQLAEALVVILASKKVDRDTKLRVLALYAIHRQGMRDADLERLRHHARLSEEDLAAVKSLQYLGWPISYHGESAERVPAPLTSERPEQPLLFDRVKTGLQNVCEQYIANRLDDQSYKYCGDEPDKVQEAISTATSLRNPRQRATWAQSVTTNNSPSSSLDGGSGGGREVLGKKSRKTLIVFVVGGVTASESAAAYTISENTAFSVLVGGHDLLTPHKYLGFLRGLTQPREKLNLVIDQPPKPVPEHLSVSDRQTKKAAVATATTAAPVSSSAKPAPKQPSAITSLGGKRPTAGKPPGMPAANMPGSTVSPTNNGLYGPAYGSQMVGQSLNAMSLTAPPKEKEKKDIKHRLKGAFLKKK